MRAGIVTDIHALTHPFRQAEWSDARQIAPSSQGAKKHMARVAIPIKVDDGRWSRKPSPTLRLKHAGCVGRDESTLRDIDSGAC
jgi:hypothetical protein